MMRKRRLERGRNKTRRGNKNELRKRIRKKTPREK